MVFSSHIFLFVFLPVFLGVYYIAGGRLRNFVALLGSLVFYGWGALPILPLLVVSSVVDYAIGSYLARAAADSARARLARILFGLGVALNLLFLGYFKYANFFVQEVNQLLTLWGVSQLGWSHVVMPVGISFFTFQKLSYLVDVYKERVRPATSFSNYLLYVSLFPQLIAGPIVRYHDIAQELEAREHSAEVFFYGMFRFCVGLAKKVLIADELGKVADNVFGWNFLELSPEYAWCGLLCYSMQIYFDFSGYSDMAIGLGRMMGFKFLENFNCPYISENISEFWRRWHISLSNWMREYLYIPLGGNRCGSARCYLNLWLVFLASGFWHGAAWNFVMWGVYHGVFLVLDRLVWLRVSQLLPRTIRIASSFLIVVLGWVLFRSSDLDSAITFYQVLFGYAGQSSQSVLIYRAEIIHNRGLFVLTLALLLSFLPAFSSVYRIAENYKVERTPLLQASFRFALAIPCLIFAVFALAANRFSPFLYYNF